jgi:hypothetical protein
LKRQLILLAALLILSSFTVSGAESYQEIDGFESATVNSNDSVSSDTFWSESTDQGSDTSTFVKTSNPITGTQSLAIETAGAGNADQMLLDSTELDSSNLYDGFNFSAKVRTNSTAGDDLGIVLGEYGIGAAELKIDDTSFAYKGDTACGGSFGSVSADTIYDLTITYHPSSLDFYVKDVNGNVLSSVKDKDCATAYDFSQFQLRSQDEVSTVQKLEWDNVTYGVTSSSTSNISNNNMVNSDELLGFWSLNQSSGDFTDYSNYSNPLTANGGITRQISSAPNTPDQYASSFDGADDYASSNADTYDASSLGDEFSVSAWCKPTSSELSDGDNGRCITKDGGNLGDYVVAFQNGQVEFEVFGNEIYHSVNGGDWIHVVGAYDVSGQQKLYVNGTLEASSTAPSKDITCDSCPLGVGANSGNPNNFFNGSIDHVKVFNKSLNSAEVSNLYFTGFADTSVGSVTSVGLDLNLVDSTVPSDSVKVKASTSEKSNYTVFKDGSSVATVDEVSSISERVSIGTGTEITVQAVYFNDSSVAENVTNNISSRNNFSFTGRNELKTLEDSKNGFFFKNFNKSYVNNGLVTNSTQGFYSTYNLERGTSKTFNSFTPLVGGFDWDNVTKDITTGSDTDPVIFHNSSSTYDWWLTTDAGSETVVWKSQDTESWTEVCRYSATNDNNGFYQDGVIVNGTFWIAQNIQKSGVHHTGIFKGDDLCNMNFQYEVDDTDDPGLDYDEDLGKWLLPWEVGSNDEAIGLRTSENISNPDGWSSTEIIYSTDYHIGDPNTFKIDGERYYLTDHYDNEHPEYIQDLLYCPEYNDCKSLGPVTVKHGGDGHFTYVPEIDRFKIFTEMTLSSGGKSSVGDRESVGTFPEQLNATVHYDSTGDGVLESSKSVQFERNVGLVDGNHKRINIYDEPQFSEQTVYDYKVNFSYSDPTIYEKYVGGLELEKLSISQSDSTPPTSSDNWTETGFVDESEATVEISASDTGGSVEDIYYRVNGGSYTTVAGSSATVSISTQGNNTLEYYAEDSAGNVEAINTEYVALESNSAPTASFTTTTTDLELGVDASGSFDSEGTISELAWDWTNDGNYETVKDESQKQGQFYNVEVVSTSNGNKYLLNGTQQKNIDLEKGVNHTFNLTSSVQGHPFHITTSSVGGNFNGIVTEGVTVTNPYNGNEHAADSGKLYYKPPVDESRDLYYQCGIHSYMGADISLSTHTLSDPTATHTYGSEGVYNVKLRVTDNDGATDTQVETISVSSSTDDGGDGGDGGGGGGGTTDTTPPDTTDNWDVSGFLDKTQAAVSLSATDAGVGVNRIEYQINGNGFTSVSGNSASVDIFTEGNNTLEYYAVDNNGNEEQTNTEYVAFKTSTDDGGSDGDGGGDDSQGTVSLQLDSPQGDIDKDGATEINQVFDTTVDVNNSGTLELQISSESQTGFTAVDGKAIGINSDQSQQFTETFKIDYSNISDSKQVSEEISYRLEWQGDNGYSLASSVQKFRYINNIGGTGNNATGLFGGVPSGLGVYLLLVLLLGVLALPLLIKVRLND